MGWFLCLLPYRAALAVGWGMAWLGHYVGRFRVRQARARIREVFGDRFSGREVRRIAWRSWRNFVFSGVEMLRIPTLTPERILSVVEVGEGMRKLQERAKNGQGSIVALAHMGSWEMANAASGALRIPLFSIAARQKNEWVDAHINRLRSRTGFETLLRDVSVMKGILRKIKEGKTLAILPDVRMKTEGIPVRFLGKTANVAGGIGLIARHTGAPVFPCVITRIGWARHRYQVFEPIWPDSGTDKHEDSRRILQAVFDLFDEHIRAQPEQWFWYNKRWILDPLV